jgi:hypothetical protein
MKVQSVVLKGQQHIAQAPIVGHVLGIGVTPPSTRTSETTVAPGGVIQHTYSRTEQHSRLGELHVVLHFKDDKWMWMQGGRLL